MIDKTKWALIRKGPLTASGYDEIIATGIYRIDILGFARALNIKLNRNEYAIVRKNDE